MEAITVRPHAVSVLSMSKDALGLHVGQAWDEIEKLRTALNNALEALTDLPTNQDCEGVRLAQEIIEAALIGETI